MHLPYLQARRLLHLSVRHPVVRDACAHCVEQGMHGRPSVPWTQLRHVCLASESETTARVDRKHVPLLHALRTFANYTYLTNFQIRESLGTDEIKTHLGELT